jgi:branched-subunit amino acid aminotransferase/4-amino-4-deoxychorismate lyase
MDFSAWFEAFVGGRWLTPSVERCGIAGVARAWVLGNVPGAQVGNLSAAEVSHASALFLCNSVRGILPVARLGMIDGRDDRRRWAVRGRRNEVGPAWGAGRAEESPQARDCDPS